MCPSCEQELSPRIASTKAPAEGEEKVSTKKMYYLFCQFCRWSSRDVGIPDQSSVTGGWPDRENIHANRLQELLDLYKAIVLAQKQQQEKDKKQRGKYISYTDRTGVTAAALRKRIGLPADLTHPLLKSRPKEPEPMIAQTEVEKLPDDIFTKPINLMDITTIEQRLLQPESQPTTVDKLFPVHKQLSIKRTLRCKTCEHNVSKPEYNPSSVKFKIQLFAYYHIPEIRIVTVEPLRAGRPCELILKFTNPTQHQTTISFFELNLDEQEDIVENKLTEVVENVEQLSLQEKQPMSLTSQPSSSLTLSSRSPSIIIKPRKIMEYMNCNIEVPESTFVLPPRDDAAEYDDSGETHNIHDDPKLVKWRKSNKAFIKLNITPDESLPLNAEVVCGFIMQHVYTNTITGQLEKKEPQKYDHKVKVFLTLGQTVGSE